jgi:hypothetical protein
MVDLSAKVQEPLTDLGRKVVLGALIWITRTELEPRRPSPHDRITLSKGAVYRDSVIAGSGRPRRLDTRNYCSRPRAFGEVSVYAASLTEILLESWKLGIMAIDVRTAKLA